MEGTSTDNKLDKQRWLALCKAARENNIEEAKKLIDAGVDPKMCYDNYLPPLHCAAEGDSVGIIEYLLSVCKVDVNSKALGATALCEATQKGKLML